MCPGKCVLSASNISNRERLARQTWIAETLLVNIPEFVVGVLTGVRKESPGDDSGVWTTILGVP